MLCDRCQDAEATVHQIQVNNNEVNHVQLCEACAEDDMGKETGSESTVIDILSGISDDEEIETESCPQCGMTIEEIEKVGRVGCARCYEHFSEKIESLIHRIHGSDRHVETDDTASSGLQTVSSSRKVQLLEKQLQESIEAENYEKAAELRDRLENLKDEENNDSSD